jgi:hypothetical protein
MPRTLATVLALAALSACRPYDGFHRLADESGKVPASRFARYGAEQAQAVAIARALGQWYGGQGAEARVLQVNKAADYARTLPAVANVVPDSLGYRLTVTFKSGWRTAIVPVNDGVQPQDTPGLPAAQ